MHKFKSTKELNEYLLKQTRVLKEFDSIEKAKAFETTMISVNMCQAANSKWIICLNERDAELSVQEVKELIVKLKEKLEEVA